jgi:hypothetical protein
MSAINRPSLSIFALVLACSRRAGDMGVGATIRRPRSDTIPSILRTVQKLVERQPSYVAGLALGAEGR